MNRSVFLLVAVLCLFALPASAGTLLVNQQDPLYGSYGYGLPTWTTFSGILNTQFGAANVTVQTSPLANALNYDSLIVVLTDFAGPHPVLTAPELADLQAFLATGRRALLIGENNAWTAWNNSILSAVGGTYGGMIDPIESDLTPVLVHPLTAGVSLLRQRADGFAIGGTSLFNQNVATLWGGGQNALSVLSANIMENSYLSESNNMLFTTNMAAWLNQAPAPIPEPATYALVGVGIVLLGIARRKHAK